jgi:CHASE2 domain-containing sensor protein
MVVFSRALRRRNLVRIAAAALGLAWLAVLGAFGYAAATDKPNTASIVAAAAALLIAGAGILYAWREPGR